MNRQRKWLFIAFIGSLTASAASACYWQTNKYFKAVQRWQLISQQLSSDTPNDLSTLQVDPYPYMFVQVDGNMEDRFRLVDRAKGQRLGYLVMRPITFLTGKKIVACQGWIPSDLPYIPENRRLVSSGLLKSAEKVDYLHNNMSKDKIQKSGINSFINLPKLLEEFQIEPDTLNQSYYVQLLKKEGDPVYPVRYTKKDFELPYLTPAKHKDYATFWGCTTLVGLTAIFKVLTM